MPVPIKAEWKSQLCQNTSGRLEMTEITNTIIQLPCYFMVVWFLQIKACTDRESHCSLHTFTSHCLHFALNALLYAQNLAMGCFKMQPFYSVLQLTNVSQEMRFALFHSMTLTTNNAYKS